MTYTNWPEHMWPIHGPMTLAQVSEAMRTACNRAHEYASTWGMKDTAGGYYSAWLWCQEGLAGRPRGHLNWLAARKIQQCQEVLALDDTITAHHVDQ